MNQRHPEHEVRVDTGRGERAGLGFLFELLNAGSELRAELTSPTTVGPVRRRGLLSAAGRVGVFADEFDVRVASAFGWVGHGR